MLFDDHNPPHIHAMYQGYKASIEINGGIVHGNMPRRALKLIYEWMDLRRDDLLANWKSIEERKPLQKIEPLE